MADRENGAVSAKWSGIEIDPQDPTVRPFLMLADGLRRYHRHSIRNLDRLGRLLREGKRVVAISNHALDVIDPLLFVAALAERYGRIPQFIGHENFIFKSPFLGDLARKWQVIPSRQPEETAEALRRNGFVMLFPGAASESLMRDYRTKPYQLEWQGKCGFLRLALENDAEIVFVATSGNDAMYYQSRVSVPRPILAAMNAGDGDRYGGARMQFGLTGPHLFPTMLPMPVRITHHVSEPIALGDREAARTDLAALEVLHRRVRGRCQSFLTGAVNRERAQGDRIDRGVRGVYRLLNGFGL